MKKNILIKSLVFCVFISFGVVVTSCDKDKTGGDTGETSKIEGVALDAISFENLSGALVALEAVGSKKSADMISSSINTTVGVDGKYAFNDIAKGIYNIIISYDGYKTMSAFSVDLNSGNPFVAFLPVSNEITTPVAGITGVVLNNQGNPVANANIAISAQDESITNGYFSSVTTNEFGQFFIGAVPVSLTNEFKVRCIAGGFNTKVISNIEAIENEMKVLYFNLETETPSTMLFYEGFEGSNDWEMTGFWHVQTNASIFNQAYPTYVKLAPNDESEGRIPNAYKGTHVAWYGEAKTGNFMGEQSPNDNELSGGRSVSSNKGNMISPVINLSSVSEASLNFWSWFEIESVNPNQYGYDLMEVWVTDVDGENASLLGKLNPYTDPILSNRAALPYTSGGFNQAPVWKYEEFDLSSFTGGSIRLKFVFDTRDHLYNGYRGWIVDEIKVVDKAAVEAKAMPDASRPLMERE